MKYKPSLRKRRIAIFLLITFMQSVVLPPVASALTSGPTAPETMSFEPVDATDMVNLSTGDFTYNIPLLEVPGPEGGYPLSMAYHAGIRPLEEASWVGLGWSLSPGAINRSVNGYPDDHKNVNRTVEDRWDGGVTKTYSVGIGIGIANGVELGLDISVSNDTYRGFGGDVGLSAMVGPKYGPNASAAVSVGSNGFKGSASVGVSTKSGIKLSATLSTDFKGGTTSSFKASMGTSRTSVGMSLSSGRLKPSHKVGGFSGIHQNNNSGNISTETSGFKASIPVAGVIVSLGARHTRYWMHETDVVKVNGVLHADQSDPGTLVDKVIQDEHVSFDSYSLHMTDADITEHFDPEWLQGGSYPAYDNYSVNGQGIGGNIQPYIFENGSLYRKQIRTGQDQDLDLSFYHMRPFTKKVNFRFVNDFSNTLQINPPPLNLSITNPSSSAQSFSVIDNTGYNATDQHLAGSKHIEWYTNRQIIANNSPTLMNYLGLSNSDRATHTTTDDIMDQMGGVSITNESGVTYHYALPVYSFDEYTYTKKVDEQNVDSWNKQINNTPYAYTWLLTAVTGPDYVDKNNNRHVDEGDWGYWVEFEYGKWAHDYAWRNPASGTFKDLNEKSDSYSYGKKNLYYLDAIKTRTHTALFIKDIRKDSKSVTSKDDGGAEPRETILCTQGDVNHTAFTELPVSTMRLDRILLYKNSSLEENNFDLNTVRQHGELPGDGVFYFRPCDFTSFTKNFHYSDNVLDVSDMNHFSIFGASSDILKRIELNNNHYDLCPNTDNSFNEISSLYFSAPPTVTKSGKLTLKSLKYVGRNNQTIMPSLKFTYDYPNQTHHDFSVNTSSVIWIDGANNDWIGKIVKYTKNNLDYYALLTEAVFTSTFSFIPIGDNAPVVGHTNGSTIPTQLVKTKNPPFEAEKYDYWGYYKSDYDGAEGVSPGNVERIPTSLSTQSTDAWSLCGIETSLGAKIEIAYENKMYQNNVWQRYDKLNLDVATQSPNPMEVTMKFHEDVDLEDIFSVGDVVKFSGYTYAQTPIGNAPLALQDDLDLTILSVSNDAIVVQNPFTAFTFFLGVGFIKFMRSNASFGNGIRTASIAVKGDDTRKTIYSYQDGCISYNPSSLEYIDTGLNANDEDPYKSLFHEDLNYILALARELPPPSVMYGQVSVSEEYNGIAVPGSNRYTFQVPEQNMIDIEYTAVQGADTSSDPDVFELSKRRVTIKDKTARIGNMLKMEVFNGQNMLVSKTEHDYTDDEAGEDETDYDAYNDQGIIHQAFHELRTKYTFNGNHQYIKGVVSVRKEFPSILKSTTGYSQGITTTTKNIDYDFYSGQLINSETKNQKGEYYRQTSIPAYKKYDDMGLKIFDVNKHHMLSQTAYTQTSELDDWEGNVTGVVGAGVTIWNDDWSYRSIGSNGYTDVTPTVDKEKVWRKHKSYVWKSELKPDGTLSAVPDVADQDMNWSTGQPTIYRWEAANTVTRYDPYSKVLEERDIDDIHAALKMGYDESMIIAINGNAKYTEFAFSGAEDYDASTGYFGGEVRKGGASLNTVPYQQGDSHTGAYALSLDNQEEGFLFRAQIGTDVEEFNTRGRRYRASVWWRPNAQGIDADQGRLFYRIETAGGSVLSTGSGVLTPASERKAGEWHQLNLDIEIPSGYSGNYLVVGVSKENNTSHDIYFDDFRFYPSDAPVTAYVYDKLTGQLTYILDENNMFTQFEYNDRGQLIKTYSETTENPTGKRLVTETKYDYYRYLD
ncbi:MAG: hypothetical protein AAGG75_23195 [Bacteroidota bacterium]